MKPVKRDWGVGYSKDQTFIVVHETKGWRAIAATIIENIPSRLCCGRLFGWALLRPIHGLRNIPVRWQKSVWVPCSAEDAQIVSETFFQWDDGENEEDEEEGNSG